MGTLPFNGRLGAAVVRELTMHEVRRFFGLGEYRSAGGVTQSLDEVRSLFAVLTGEVPRFGNGTRLEAAALEHPLGHYLRLVDDVPWGNLEEMTDFLHYRERLYVTNLIRYIRYIVNEWGLPTFARDQA